MKNNFARVMEETQGPRAELRDPQATVQFMLAGNAIVTFQGRRERFTYRVQSAKSAGGAPSHFVALLTGPDNSRSYEYLGCIYQSRAYAHGRNSKIPQSAMAAVAFTWVWRTLSGGNMHPELGVWHEGRCGKCGRRLTTPRSILIGLGPTCEGRQT